MILTRKNMRAGCRVVVGNLLSMCEALDFFPSSGAKGKRIINILKKTKYNLPTKTRFWKKLFIHFAHHVPVINFVVIELFWNSKEKK